MKGSTNQKSSFKNKVQEKRDHRDNRFNNTKSKSTNSHQFNKAMPPSTQSLETLPTLGNLAAIGKEERTSYANKVISSMLQFLPNYIVKK